MPSIALLLALVQATTQAVDPLAEANRAYTDGKYVVAEYAILRTLKDADKKDKLLSARAYLLLSQIKGATNLKEDEWKLANRSLGLAREALDPYTIGRAERSLAGLSLSYRKDSKAALKHYLESLKHLKDVDTDQANQVRIRLGDIYFSQKEWKLATDQYLPVWPSVRAEGARLVRALLEQGKLEDAFIHARNEEKELVCKAAVPVIEQLIESGNINIRTELLIRACIQSNEAIHPSWRAFATARGSTSLQAWFRFRDLNNKFTVPELSALLADWPYLRFSEDLIAPSQERGDWEVAVKWLLTEYAKSKDFPHFVKLAQIQSKAGVKMDLEVTRPLLDWARQDAEILSKLHSQNVVSAAVLKECALRASPDLYPAVIPLLEPEEILSMSLVLPHATVQEAIDGIDFSSVTLESAFENLLAYSLTGNFREMKQDGQFVLELARKYGGDQQIAQAALYLSYIGLFTSDMDMTAQGLQIIDGLLSSDSMSEGSDITLTRAYYNLQMGKVVEARSQFVQVTADFSNRDSGLTGLAWTYLQEGNYEVALSYANRASDISSDAGPVTKMILARCYEGLGKWEEAEEQLMRMLADFVFFRVGLPGAMLHDCYRELAYVYQALGKDDLATQMLLDSQDAEKKLGMDRGAKTISVVPDLSRAGPSRPQDPAAEANTAEQLTRAKSYALIVGGSKFDSYHELPNAKLDAEDLRDVLKSKYGYEVTYLENPTQKQFQEALTMLEEIRFGPCDQVFVYIAGHGGFDPRFSGYLVFKDTPKVIDQVPYIYPLLELRLSALKASQVLVMLDVCYSGAFVRWLEQGTSAYRGDMAAPTADTIAREFRDPSKLVLTAGDANEPVSDGVKGQHSPFASGVLQNLKQPGSDGIITYNELMSALQWSQTKVLGANFQQYRRPGSNYIFLSKEARAKLKAG